MADEARHAEITVSFDGTDVSQIVNKYLISLSYLDNEEDQADDLQIKLEDRGGEWLQKWLQDYIDKAAENSSAAAAQQAFITVNDIRAGIRKTVSNGTKNYDGAICQMYLQGLGFLTSGITVKCNGSTVAAIKAFQRANGLGVTGKCDKRTWKKLTAAVNGKSIPAYTCTFKATKAVTVRKTCQSSAKSVVPIAKGKTCILTDHCTKSWYAANYNGKNGYVKLKGLKLESVDPAIAASASSSIKGMSVKASISMVETNGKKITTDCGLFELDDIKATGPASAVTIKALSLGYSGIRKTKQDKSWEHTTLKTIATTIANTYGLGVLFDFDTDPYYNRVEQSGQTDIELLKRLCQECGMSLKITDNQIVIYDQAKYEALQAVAQFTFGDGRYTKWSTNTGGGEIRYDVCEVRYCDPSTGDVITGVAYSEEYQKKLDQQSTSSKKKSKKKKKAKKSKKKKSTEKSAIEKIEKLIVTDHAVSNIDEATALAEKMLRLANKFEAQVTLTTKGNPIYCAGMVVTLNDFGYWSGDYLISKAKHDVSSGNGYTTTLTLRRVNKYDAGSDVGAAYKKGDTVTFNANYQYKSSTAKKPDGGKKKGGKAKIMKVGNLSDPHPYKLQGGKYNKLKGSCNVNKWVNAGTFT